jgi:uncharacterized metal-binding protein
MPNAEWHEKYNLIAIAIASTVLYLRPSFTIPIIGNNVSFTIFDIGILIVSFLIGTFYVNPDLDTGSRCRNRWWIFKFIWKPFHHRKILHSPIMWLAMMGIAYFYTQPIYVIALAVLMAGVSFYQKYQLYTLCVVLVMYALTYGLMIFTNQYLWIVGIVISSFVHLLADTVMDGAHGVGLDI